MSQEMNSATKIVDQAGLDIKYQEELRQHLGRKDALKEGLNKAYALIYTNYCTKTMREERNKNEDGNNPTSFAQREMTCYCCGKKGHLSPECDKKNTIPREQWHVNRAMQHHQEADGNVNDNANDNENADIDEDDDSVQTTASSTSTQNRRSGTTRSPRTPQSTTRSIVRWNDNGVNAFQF